jgi:phosphoglycolate phosphatase
MSAPDLPTALPTALPRAVLFDWDNTLISNWRCVHSATNAALAAFGKPTVSLEESYGQARRSLRDSFPEIFGAEWKRALDIFYAHFEAHHLAELEILPGAEALLRELQRAGIYQGVVSNKTGRLLRKEAEALGWTPYFGRLVGATDADADKPSSAPVILALEPACLSPGREVWFIGDADIDMECAHRANCTPVLVGHTPMVHKGLDRFPPRYRFDDCGIISDLVRHLFDTISVKLSD